MICIHCGEPVFQALRFLVHTRSDTRRCIANGGWAFTHAEVWPAPTTPCIVWQRGEWYQDAWDGDYDTLAEALGCCTAPNRIATDAEIVVQP